jgi:hypothetical protein
LNPCSGEECDTAAKVTLKPIVLAGIQKDRKNHENRRSEEKMQATENPKNCAAQPSPGTRHM